MLFTPFLWYFVWYNLWLPNLERCYAKKKLLRLCIHFFVLQHCWMLVFVFFSIAKKMLLITICLFYVWLVSFRSIAECWFWTDASWIVYLCFLIHDCIQSQLVNLRLLLWVFLGRGGVSNGSLSLPLWWTKSDFNAICFRTCVSFFTLHFAFSGNKNASFCFP
jgi:hypothetical protein